MATGSTFTRLMTRHPALHLIDVRCSTCGATFATRSTAQAISVDVCSNCHPAYTGRERAVAAGGRIERFNRRRALAAA
jgi:large subunit ribosomal protein L31